MAFAMNNAKKEILITDWALSVFYYIDRTSSNKKVPVNKTRLDLILNDKANEGVQIRVLIYKEAEITKLNLESVFVKNYLNDLHPNIKCVFHPNYFKLAF
jgi:phospholipase D1/2